MRSGWQFVADRLKCRRPEFRGSPGRVIVIRTCGCVVPCGARAIFCSEVVARLTWRVALGRLTARSLRSYRAVYPPHAPAVAEVRQFGCGAPPPGRGPNIYAALGGTRAPRHSIRSSVCNGSPTTRFTTPAPSSGCKLPGRSRSHTCRVWCGRCSVGSVRNRCPRLSDLAELAQPTGPFMSLWCH